MWLSQEIRRNLADLLEGLVLQWPGSSYHPFESSKSPLFIPQDGGTKTLKRFELSQAFNQSWGSQGMHGLICMMASCPVSELMLTTRSYRSTSIWRLVRLESKRRRFMLNPLFRIQRQTTALWGQLMDVWFVIAFRRLSRLRRWSAERLEVWEIQQWEQEFWDPGRWWWGENGKKRTTTLKEQHKNTLKSIKQHKPRSCELIEVDLYWFE